PVGRVGGEWLGGAAAAGPFAEEALGQRQTRGEGQAWRIVETGEPLAASDAHRLGLGPATPIRSYLAVPLEWRGRVFGVLEIDSSEGDAFGEPDLGRVRRGGAAG